VKAEVVRRISYRFDSCRGHQLNIISYIRLRGHILKFKITYECRTGENVYQDTFEVETEGSKVPDKYDPEVNAIASEKTNKFKSEGQFGLKILDISPLGE